MENTETNMQKDAIPDDSDRRAVVNAFRAVDSAWARYGLNVGRAALETSARSLQVTATALGQLAEAIESRSLNAQEKKHDELDIATNRKA